MGRRRRDAIDLACLSWAEERRRVLGLSEPTKATQYLGAVRCTLAKRRDLHAGSSTNRRDQHWPEVYEGEAAEVNRAFLTLAPELKVFMTVHYCVRWSAQKKADLLQMDIYDYWEWLRVVKDRVAKFIG